MRKWEVSRAGPHKTRRRNHENQRTRRTAQCDAVKKNTSARARRRGQGTHMRVVMQFRRDTLNLPNENTETQRQRGCPQASTCKVQQPSQECRRCCPVHDEATHLLLELIRLRLAQQHALWPAQQCRTLLRLERHILQARSRARVRAGARSCSWPRQHMHRHRHRQCTTTN